MTCLLAGRHQAITCAYAGSLLIGPLETYFSQNLHIFIQENAFENVVCKLAAILSRPQYVNGTGQQKQTKWNKAKQTAR